MEKAVVKDVHGKILFTGTKQECMHFAKVKRFQRGEFTVGPVTVEPEQPIVKTTAPIEANSKGFFKRVFGK